MLFQLEQGPIQSSQAFANSRKNLFGVKPAKALPQCPELRQGLELYYDAFFDLSTERHHGAGWMYIRWSDCVQYACFYDFDDDQLDRLLLHIKAMDIAYIAKLEADAELKRQKK